MNIDDRLGGSPKMWILNDQMIIAIEGTHSLAKDEEPDSWWVLVPVRSGLEPVKVAVECSEMCFKLIRTYTIDTIDTIDIDDISSPVRL